MSGLFKNQQVLGCSSCAGLGETTQEDLQRWMKGDFWWRDLGWCALNWKTVTGLLTGMFPLTVYGAWSGGGRIPMDKDVPFVAPSIANVWPCVPEEEQKKVNAKAAAARNQPAPPNPDKPDEPFNVIPITKQGRGQAFAAIAVIGLAALIFVKSRKSARKFDYPAKTQYRSGGFKERRRRRRTNR